MRQLCAIMIALMTAPVCPVFGTEFTEKDAIAKVKELPHFKEYAREHEFAFHDNELIKNQDALPPFIQAPAWRIDVHTVTHDAEGDHSSLWRRFILTPSGPVFQWDSSNDIYFEADGARGVTQDQVDIVVYRNDPAHQPDGDRCMSILAAEGIEARQIPAYFTNIRVARAQAQKAMSLIANAIEKEGLRARLLQPRIYPSFENVAWYYYDKDKKDGERAEAILYKNKFALAGFGHAGTTAISVEPSQAAVARQILARAIKTEGLHLTIMPAEAQTPSPGNLYFLRHATIPPDQSPDGQERHRLIVVKNIELYANTFTSETVWEFEQACGSLELAWSPDSRFLLFGTHSAKRAPELYYVDVMAAKPKAVLLNLTEAAQRAAARSGEAEAAKASTCGVDLKQIDWLDSEVCRLHSTASTHESLKLNLADLQPRLVTE